MCFKTLILSSRLNDSYSKNNDGSFGTAIVKKISINQTVNAIVVEVVYVFQTMLAKNCYQICYLNSHRPLNFKGYRLPDISDQIILNYGSEL
jgi:hypothetical protein